MRWFDRVPECWSKTSLCEKNELSFSFFWLRKNPEHVAIKPSYFLATEPVLQAFGENQNVQISQQINQSINQSSDTSRGKRTTWEKYRHQFASHLFMSTKLRDFLASISHVKIQTKTWQDNLTDISPGGFPSETSQFPAVGYFQSEIGHDCRRPGQKNSRHVDLVLRNRRRNENTAKSHAQNDPGGGNCGHFPRRLSAKTTNQRIKWRMPCKDNN